jgi:hypothetical protein
MEFDALRRALDDAAAAYTSARLLVFDRGLGVRSGLTGVQRDALVRLEASERRLDEVRRARSNTYFVPRQALAVPTERKSEARGF